MRPTYAVQTRVTFGERATGAESLDGPVGRWLGTQAGDGQPTNEASIRGAILTALGSTESSAESHPSRLAA